MRLNGMVALGVLLTVLGLEGCIFSENDVETVTPPLVFRFSTPHDSTEGYYEPEGLPLSMTFRRNIKPNDIATVWLIPPPVSAGELVAGLNSDRELLWPDVVLDPDVLVYRWFVDGPFMSDPVMIRFHPGAAGALTGLIQGRISIGAPYPDATGALLLALRRFPPAEGNYAEAESLLGLPIEAIALVPPKPPTADRSLYVVPDLVLGQRYVLVAILDTNDDGRYETHRDWWGYPIEEGSTIAPQVLTAFDGLTSSAVDFTIVPPGTRNPIGF